MPKSFDNFQDMKYNESNEREQLRLKKNMQSLLNKGSFSLEINVDKQMPHDFSSNHYKEYVARNIANTKLLKNR